MNSNTVLLQFRVLERNCSKPPYNNRGEAQEHASDWLRVLGELSDEQLEAAVTAWLRSPKGRFWPRPTEILALVPRPRLEPDEPDENEDDWPGRIWAELSDGQLRVRLLDQATAEVRDNPHCMREEGQRCLPDCDPCLQAIMRRCDELASQHLEAA